MIGAVGLIAALAALLYARHMRRDLASERARRAAFTRWVTAHAFREAQTLIDRTPAIVGLPHKRRGIGMLNEAYAAADYHDSRGVVQTIKTLKSGRIDKRHARLIAAALAREIEHVYLYAGWSCDLIVPAPTSPTAIGKRGFNHSALIGAALARRLNIPFAVVLDKGDSTSQKQQRRGAARMNITNTIHARRNVTGAILVVDDVMTTGATMHECARALKEAGATAVYGLAVAATRDW